MLSQQLDDVLKRLDSAAKAAGRPRPSLVAVGKTQPAERIVALAAAWMARGERPAFGENYVQEALAKQAGLTSLNERVDWHLIGHLQSNKAREAATHFDWVQTVDRPKLVEALARHRPAGRSPLNVLIQVNIDDEASKHGCRPEEVAALADAIDAQPRLRLRGLMVIPRPHEDPALRREAFRRSAALFAALQPRGPQIDTLSMGMSDDFEIATQEGATMVRVGSALFGARPPKR